MFSKPGMLKSGFGCYSLLWAVDKDFAEEIEEEFVELVGGGNNVLFRVRGAFVGPVGNTYVEVFHCFDIFL